MQTELEAKWLDIEAAAIRAQLQNLQANLVYSERLMRRKNFDYPDRRLQQRGGWIRVRDEGDKITLGYKELQHRRVDGTKEVSLTVDDFSHAVELLNDIGLQSYAYQETRRELWKLGTADVSIDTWPWIPTFLEIEGPDETSIRTAAQQLHLGWDETLHGSVEVAYQKYYDVSEAEIDGWPEITFSPVPDWLERKRRT